MLNDVLYYGQLIMTVASGYSQLMKLRESSEGTSLTWILLWMCFILVNLLLAVHASKENPTRENSRLKVAYGLWLFIGLAWFLTMLDKGTLSWNDYDNLSLAVASGCVIMTLLAAIYFKWYEGPSPSAWTILSDPWTRACLGLSTKTVAQLVMAIEYARGNHLAMADVSVWSGHVGILMRLAQTALATRSSGFSRSLAAILISETGNWLSWLAFTIVWLLY